MKKKNLKHNGLNLNKNVVSSLESQNVMGGATNSCLIFVNTDCAYTAGCNFTNGCPQTNGCQTNGCPPRTNFDCPFISESCPVNGIC
ncbi:hypothetical protein KORDIASMS9_02162 [Kordia sp. SMS9]|uniref:hypothetical protein n=1 Tax=Kordia sp. SMS9 TaxID=2282170 RepID=UPI000E100CAB|nr:hypothetical protein [Kordia sp. SMS9]AXG69934.1 hypothetical protein KORDIASMS9_02162 [Kordia sp. SMS9]